MRNLTSAMLRLALCGLLAGPLAITARAQTDKAGVALEASGGRHLTIDELYRLYANHSWNWKDGAGYFQARKRLFLSTVSNGGDISFAEGQWFLTSWGRLCFQADWHAASGSSEALTCFEHRTAGGNIYQRRLPDGDWYVFRHATPVADDEANKLRYGDYVSEKLRQDREMIAGSGAGREKHADFLARFLGLDRK